MKQHVYRYTGTLLALMISAGVTYAQPIIMSVTPPVGPTSGGTMITINGTGFTGVSHVLFGQNGTQTPAQW